MSAVATKPLSIDQFKAISEDLLKNDKVEILAISLLLMKATRIGDLLNVLTINDVFTVDGKVRNQIEYSEGKTKKRKILEINGNLLISTLEKLYTKVSHRSRTDNLFYSRKATGNLTNTPMTNITVNRNLQKYVGMWGIGEISTHALRKTACRYLFDSGKPIETIQKLLNHSNSRITERYICVNSADVSDAQKLLDF